MQAQFFPEGCVCVGVCVCVCVCVLLLCLFAELRHKFSELGR